MVDPVCLEAVMCTAWALNTSLASTTVLVPGPQRTQASQLTMLLVSKRSCNDHCTWRLPRVHCKSQERMKTQSKKVTRSCRRGLVEVNQESYRLSGQATSARCPLVPDRQSSPRTRRHHLQSAARPSTAFWTKIFITTQSQACAQLRRPLKLGYTSCDVIIACSVSHEQL